ncbi:MAG: flagellar hook assembly protein FlgD [Deltaproteobacteria bacterium]|nr:flagellar hook assembly protein FlgD [Deltaproteobacteria bacterium]
MGDMVTQTVGRAGVPAGAGGPSANPTAKSLGKEDFLKLLVTQLKNQNPLEPLDNAEFIAQLAQFSTLEGITNMGTNLKTFAADMASMSNYYATWLIGKEIRAYGNSVNLNGLAPASMGYHLASGAAKVTVTVYNGGGNAVRTMEEGAKAAGYNSALWDGKDSNGNSLPPGQYTFKVSAASGDGQGVPAGTVMAGLASGVVYEEGVPYLIVGTEKVRMSDVVEVWNR